MRDYKRGYVHMMEAMKREIEWKISSTYTLWQISFYLFLFLFFFDNSLYKVCATNKVTFVSLKKCGTHFFL